MRPVIDNRQRQQLITRDHPGDFLLIHFQRDRYQGMAHDLYDPRIGGSFQGSE
ncbi:MAG: hypothetical protein HND59_11745 [Pseudomonadota bacterium]|nr:MAG: hypothetical protein HND59_11745 [Pseudomonadota bacterium]